MGDTTAIIALSRDARLKILTSHGQGEHRHRLVTRPASVIKTAQDLIGKTIAVKKGTSTHGGMLRYLDAHDVAEDSIQLVDMSPSEMPDALFAGSIEAFAASEPTPSLAEQRGAVQVTSFGGLGNSYPILIMTAQDFIQANPQRIQDFLTALGKAETFIREHPEDTVRILSPITGLSEALTRAAMKRHRFKLDVSEDIIRSLKTTADFMLQQGSITTNPELDKCIAGNRKIVD
jgi:ABC-type nitrate/sulfonate/bicarbonate transport system substrate-binding protein